MGVDIFHFNQAAGAGAPFTNDACTKVYVQPQREPIARALFNAVNKMKTYLSFWPRPIYTSEIIPLGRGTPYQLQHLQTSVGKLIKFGQRATSLIQSNVTIAYSDADGDGVDDLATIQVTTGIADDEIAIFFRTADGAPASADERYEITPITVTSSSGVVTITAPRAYFVKPNDFWHIPWDKSDPNKREENDATTTNVLHFVATVDVYRVYTDTTTPLQVVSDPIHTQTSQLSQSLATTGVARIVDAELGLFEARVESCAGCQGPIESVRVFYKAGEALQYGRMEAELEEAILRLANTLMPEQPTTLCQPAWEKWSQDRQPMRRDNVFTMQEKDLGNPFGLLQGQVNAWHVVQERKITRGGKITRGIR